MLKTILDLEKKSEIVIIENNNLEMENTPMVNTTGKILKLLYKYINYFMFK